MKNAILSIHCNFAPRNRIPTLGWDSGGETFTATALK